MGDLYTSGSLQYVTSSHYSVSILKFTKTVQRKTTAVIVGAIRQHTFQLLEREAFLKKTSSLS